MEAAQIGVVRDSMLANPLLIRPALGKARSRGLSFPGPDFVYGMATSVRDGGVPEAISHWHSHSLPGNQSSARAKMGEKDFVALNREGVKSGLVTAKEHYQIPDMTFGVPTRPSTPIADLLEHQYSKRWLEEQQAKDRARLERRHPAAVLSLSPLLVETASFPGGGARPGYLPQPRSPEKAFSAHYSDSVARRGHLGQGTYNLS
ncbi:hypothetical protein ANANG_G00193120 [Anguilla anguilla]|uniref:Uncharacterized protein n=1 Tax=Anguilla anguilla TaxID=7936 RepID=A0A9D3M518_ANGAN|nr:hypothetical protein ANANG_G00193120 [Anguilla anguilla]